MKKEKTKKRKEKKNLNGCMQIGGNRVLGIAKTKHNCDWN